MVLSVSHNGSISPIIILYSLDIGNQHACLSLPIFLRIIYPCIDNYVIVYITGFMQIRGTQCVGLITFI